MDGMKSFGPMGKMGGLGFAVMGDGDLTPELMDTLMKAAMAAVQGFTDAVDDDDCDDDDCDDDGDYPSGCCPSEGCDYHLHCSRFDDECESAHFDRRWKHMTGHIYTYLRYRTELKRRDDGDFDALVKPKHPPYMWDRLIETLDSETRSLGGIIKKVQSLRELWEGSTKRTYLTNLVEDVSNYLAFMGYEIDEGDNEDINDYLLEKIHITVDQEHLLSLAFLE